MELDDLGTIRIAHAWVAPPRGLELAYALTSFSIQGATNDASTSVITKGASAAELVVNLTRGRHQNLVFTMGDGEDEFAGEGPGDITSGIASAPRVRETATVARVVQPGPTTSRRRIVGLKRSTTRLATWCKPEGPILLWQFAL